MADLLPAGVVGVLECGCGRQQFVARSLMIGGETLRGLVPSVVVVHQSRPHRFGDHAVGGFELGEPIMRDFAPLPDVRGELIVLQRDAAQLIWLNIQVIGHARSIPPASVFGLLFRLPKVGDRIAPGLPLPHDISERPRQVLRIVHGEVVLPPSIFGAFGDCGHDFGG
nr:hypothetical protein [Nocardia barduliensis]